MGSHSDEYFMQNRLAFSESLKDLKNLRIQLYSAAEYFEASYEKHEYKQLVVETIKDFASKALINTVDHLGTVAFKVDSFLDERVDEMSATRLQFSVLEQKFRTCQEFVDHKGLRQQSLVIESPKFHKHYKFPVEEGKFHSNTEPMQKASFLSLQNDKHFTTPAIQQAVVKPHPSLKRRVHSRPPSAESSPAPYSFSFVRVPPNQQVAKKRSVSPFRRLPVLNRSRSVKIGSTTPPKTPAVTKNRWPSEPQAATSLVKYGEGSSRREAESKKSKPLLKALLSKHWPGKKSVPYKFKDDK